VRAYYDITKIKDITDGTAGQALIQAAGSVNDTSDTSIPDSSEKVNSETEYSLKPSQVNALKKRGVEGDDLLNAIDLADEILSVTSGRLISWL